MARQNIDKTRKSLEDRPETEQVYIDGSTSEVIFRAMLGKMTDEFEEWVEEHEEVNLQNDKYLGFATEVELR